MTTLIVETPPGDDAKWDYVLSVVLGDWLGLDWQHKTVNTRMTKLYVAETPARWLKMPASYFLGEPLPQSPLPRWDTSELGDALSEGPLPVMFGSSDCKAIVRGGCVELPADIFGMAFFLLARVEEYGYEGGDAHARFQASDSVAYREGFLHRPVVDEYINVLKFIIGRLWPSVVFKESTFRILPTHDVDRPARFSLVPLSTAFRATLGELMRRRNPGGFLRGCWLSASSRGRIHPADPFNSFDWLMDISEASGVFSTFYFFGRNTGIYPDATYGPDEVAIRQLLKGIASRNHQIGLHASYKTYQDTSALKQEYDELRRVAEEEGVNQELWGCRMHYLRWTFPDTLCAIDHVGLSHDSTMGYPDVAGFRCGTAREYPAFDMNSNLKLGLRLRPMAVMEAAILNRMDTSSEPSMSIAYDEFIALKRRCRAFGGDFTILWHNNLLYLNEQRSLYESVISGD